MARRKQSAPRRGSLGVRPRKRASRIVPRIKSWPLIVSETPRLLAFLGYKVGMTHAIIIDDREGSPTYGREISVPVTIIETPPMMPLATRFYVYGSNNDLKTLTEAWIEPPKELEIHRKIATFKPNDIDKIFKVAEEKLEEIVRISIIAATQPKLAGGLEKKKPDLLEIVVGGGKDTSDKIEYVRKILGTQVSISQIFREGSFVDAIGVTKGKGFQGVIKRFGVRELPRWHKHRKGSRRIGARSPAYGAVSEAPQPGQMGYHRRTQYNLRVLMISNDPSKINPKGGFPHYGLVKSEYIALIGTVQGPPKRPIVLRYPIRPPRIIPEVAPKIVYLSLESKV
ncbi:MAG: 50S ribosomal protein L3 [Sulfolobales archaeon]